MLTKLFGSEAPDLISAVAVGPDKAPKGACTLSPEPELTSALSSLALLDAARATSPVPRSPWWAAEAAELAQRACLPGRAHAEAHQAVAKLPGQLKSLPVLPGKAARAATAVADLSSADGSQAAIRLRQALEAASSRRRDGRPQAAVLDVAAEVENLEKDRTRQAGLQWMLDPVHAPEGLLRPGLSPYSDFVVRQSITKEQVTVEATLAPEADCGALVRCLVRIVDPSIRRILALSAFTFAEPPEDLDAPPRVTAELQLPFPLDEVQESWIEVIQDKHSPVRSVKGYRVRRALRWADAALRAERAPVGLAPQSSREDWATLATVAWENCHRDWEAADDERRAALAAQRQAQGAQVAANPRACAPRSPGPACLAEILGR